MRQRFFNKAFRLFKTQGLKKLKLVAGLSGGIDSVVLLDLLRQLRGPFDLSLCVAHIHHGSSKQKPIEEHRDQAKAFAQALAKEYGLDFACPKGPAKLLKSERDFRDFRHARFQDILRQKKAQVLALAHNSCDLLETRLIQLVRGCGPEGLRSMSAWRGSVVRPLLFWTREEIREYAREQKLKWLEDPSNKDNRFLRNWMRNQWLPDLEARRGGAVKSLARSLELSAKEDLKENNILSAIGPQGIKRDLFMEMPLADQKRLLAVYMRRLKIENFGQSHIDELLKWAERRKKSFSARMLKRTWRFTPGGISAQSLQKDLS